MSARSPAQVALGASLREFRLAQGLSQEALGLESGLDRTYVGGIERGERNPSYQSLLSLTRALGVSASEVIARAEQLIGES